MKYLKHPQTGVIHNYFRYLKFIHKPCLPKTLLNSQSTLYSYVDIPITLLLGNSFAIKCSHFVLSMHNLGYDRLWEAPKILALVASWPWRRESNY